MCYPRQGLRPAYSITCSAFQANVTKIPQLHMLNTKAWFTPVMFSLNASYHRKWIILKSMIKSVRTDTREEDEENTDMYWKCVLIFATLTDVRTSDRNTLLETRNLDLHWGLGFGSCLHRGDIVSI
jgi:hypothetical protein